MGDFTDYPRKKRVVGIAVGLFCFRIEFVILVVAFFYFLVTTNYMLFLSPLVEIVSSSPLS